MTRFLAIIFTCIVVFATTGAHRAIASYHDAPQPRQVHSVDEMEESVKAPCCKTYKVHKDQQKSACSLPMVMLTGVEQLITPRLTADSWSIGNNKLYRGQLCGPGEQPPKTV